jgi:ADP-heptose:LPS heptosyltransferase
VILSLPAMEAARADYTEVWAPRNVLPLIRFADKTRAIADTGLDLVGVVEDASVAELATFDSIYSWYGSARAEFRAAVRGLPFTFFPATPPPSEGIPRIEVAAAAREDFAIVHPFSSSLAKRWPLENFRAVAKDLGVPVRWCAGPEETLEDATRFENLYDMAGWIARARIYIGNDSGITHLAAAVGTPVVAIFISSDPRIWGPRGDRVVVLEQPGVDEVILTARRFLR